VTHYLSYDELN